MFVQEHTTPLYFASDLCRAASLDPVVLQIWLGGKSRSPVILLTGFDRPAGGSGRHRLFTLTTAYQVSITAELVRRGLEPVQAAGAALLFTGLGEFQVGWNDGAAKRPPRLPSQLFPLGEGDTYLLVGAGKPVKFGMPAHNVKVMALKDDVTLGELKRNKAHTFFRQDTEDLGIIMPLNGIVARTRISLGLPALQPAVDDAEHQRWAQLQAQEA